MELLPLRAHKLSFSYSEEEDRLVLLVDSRGGQRVSILVTRRLTMRLLNALASLLERSSPTARQAPSPLRGDVVLLEHQGAVQAGARQTVAAVASPPPAAVPEPPPQLLLAPTLLTAVDISTKPSHFSLTFRDARLTLATCDVTRAALHRVVQGLLTKVGEADWNIRVDATWLGAGQQSMVVN
jgi:hypothetical protein